MSTPSWTPLQLGVNSCLLGEKSRYDGGHKRDRYIVGTLGQHVEFVPVCPEVECSFSVPREAFRLGSETRENDQVVAGSLSGRPPSIARDFKQLIRLCGMGHMRTSPYYPQSKGKLERWNRTLKQTTIRPKEPQSL